MKATTNRHEIFHFPSLDRPSLLEKVKNVVFESLTDTILSVVPCPLVFIANKIEVELKC